MSFKFSLKSSFLVLLCGFVCAAITAFLANSFLSAPRLGVHYDILLSYKKPPPVSQDILIIKTNEFAESSDLFTVLLTLTEMNGANLIFTGTVSPSSSPVVVTETEIRQRFLDEYILLGANIRNLFGAIRSGSVSPENAPDYVDRLVELTEQGRDRLLAALVDRDEDLIRSIAVFGNYQEEETKPRFDSDGKLRRVKPVDAETFVEHPVFKSLKNRYDIVQIETTDKNKILWFRAHDGSEFDIPLDRDGNIITPWNCDFRSVDISLFREYDEADLVMRTTLVRAGELGVFSQVLPEKSPLFLCDYSLLLREEMLKSPGGEKRSHWVRARNNYLDSIREFLDGPSEFNLVKGYDDVIAGEVLLGEEGLAVLAGMRDELSAAFANIREKHNTLSAIYEKLERETGLSFCVMGHEGSADYSALLANALITGAHVAPINEQYALLWSAAAAFIILLVVFWMQPALLPVFGSFLSVFAGAGFACVFIFYSYWIDPLVVVSSSLVGTLMIFFCKISIIRRRARLFRSAYGAAVSKDVLKNLICLGKPGLSDVVIANAAVIAIKEINLVKTEDHENPQNAGSNKKLFFSCVKDFAFNAGAVIAGYERDTVFVCFGSPLDNCGNPVQRACAFVKELLRDQKIAWCFGIDAGECTFFWSPETGYSVNGSPAVRSKVLVSKTVRLKIRAAITDFVREKINANVEKVDSLYGGRESVYDFSKSKDGFSV